ncbi:phage minor structural protein [Bacillus cereus BAG6X1-2]|nr:phage minor structural protein [Bacillus cereus BAG6X1-2]
MNMITLYKPNETDFTHNGLGVLDANIYEAVVEEILNGLFIFSFSYPLFAPHGLEIEGQCILKVPTPDGEQLFRVATPQPKMGKLTVFCYHIFYDLTDNLIEDTFIEEKSGTAALDQLSNRCQYPHPFQFFSDITKVASSRLVRKNPVEAILDTGQDNCFLNRWGGELKRDNFKVHMLQQRGKNRGVMIQHRKDLLGYEGEVDWKSPITRIMPMGFDGLLLPEKYVDSPNINKYVNPKIKVVEFSHIKAAIDENANDEEAVPLEEAYELLRKAAKDMFEIQKVDQPKATYKVAFQELSQTEEYKDYAVLQRVYMGDTITVRHEEDNVDIQAKVISYKYDPLKEEYMDLTIGNYKEAFAKLPGKVDQMQEDMSGMEESFLDKAKEHATDLINSGFGGHVRVYPERILIMDTDNEMTAEKVWQWNINGLGYSSTGINGPYGLAMTMDGSIVADYITTGVLNASLIKTGTLSGNYIYGGMIKGSTLRTSDDINFVDLSKQFIRLYESNKVRTFLGYYYNKRGELQPTLLLGGDTDATASSDMLMLALRDVEPGSKSASLGITRGYTSFPEVYYPSSIHFSQKGNTTLNAENYVNITAGNYVNITAGTDFFAKSKNNLYLEGTTGNMHFTTGQKFHFLKGSKRLVSINSTPYGDSDIVMQQSMLRNSDYENGYLQIKSGTGSFYGGVIAGDFKVSSKKRYKSNIRPITFDVLKKVMGWDIKQYNLKIDIPKLYEMRMNRKEGEPTITTKAVPTHYGIVIPDESEETGVNLYGMVSQLTKAFQEYVIKTDARIEKLESALAKYEHNESIIEDL